MAGPVEGEGPSDGMVEPAAQGREIAQFTDLESMGRGSALIIEGTVLSVAPGRTVGPKEDSITFRELRMEVETVWKGRVSSGEVIIVEEEGWIDDVPYSVNGSDWADEGDRTISFLVEKNDAPGRYRHISTQGRFFVDPLGRGLRPNRSDDALSADVVASEDASSLRSRLDRLVNKPG